MKDWSFFVFNKDFELFGDQHLIVMIIMVILSILFPIIGKKRLNSAQQLTFSRILAVTISFWALIYVVILLWLGKFNYQTDLPLDLCNITAVLLPFLMWKPSYRVHEILYFWVLAGTVQAIITPHLFNGFPNFIFIKYWFVHAGLVVYAIYITIVFDYKPTLRSIWRAFLALQAFVFVVLIINLLLGSNYVYLLHKPPIASALDYLGPWPWYILVAEFVAVVFFFIVYLPILFTKKRSITTVIPNDY